jgi:hypothetical protein
LGKAGNIGRIFSAGGILPSLRGIDFKGRDFGGIFLGK